MSGGVVGTTNIQTALAAGRGRMRRLSATVGREYGRLRADHWSGKPRLFTRLAGSTTSFKLVECLVID
jgi:hypothetical protein